MGSITQKIFDLLESAGNYEERRSTGIIIESNWFDAVDEDSKSINGRPITGSTNKESNRVEYTEERKFETKSNLNNGKEKNTSM